MNNFATIINNFTAILPLILKITLGIILIVILLIVGATFAPLGKGNPESLTVKPKDLSPDKKVSIYYVGGICRNFGEQVDAGKKIAEILNMPVTVMNPGSWEERNSWFGKLFLSQAQEKKFSCDNSLTSMMENVRSIPPLKLGISIRYFMTAQNLKSLITKDIKDNKKVFVYTHSGGNFTVDQLFRILGDNESHLELKKNTQFYLIGSPLTDVDNGAVDKGFKVTTITDPTDWIACYQGRKILDGEKIIDLEKTDQKFILQQLFCVKKVQENNRNADPENNPTGGESHQIEAYLENYRDELFKSVLEL